jgi:hypothetical protein
MPTKLPFVLCFRRFSPQKKLFGIHNRELPVEGAVLFATSGKFQLASTMQENLASGMRERQALPKRYLTGAVKRCRIIVSRPGGNPATWDAEPGTLNLEVPQRELNRRRNAWSSPKNNYISGTIWQHGQLSRPARFRASTNPGASVKVVCYANI